MLILWTSDPAVRLKDISSLITQAKIPCKVIDVAKGVDAPLPECGPGDMVLALGGTALEVLRAHKVCAKNRSITSLRTQPLTLPNGAQCLVSFSAGIQDTDYALYVHLLTDVQLALRQQVTGSLKPKVGSYRYVNSFDDAIQWIENRFETAKERVPITMDSETLGTDPYAAHAYLISIQVTYRPGQADVIVFHSRDACLAFQFKHQVRWLMNSPKVKLIGANWKFDANWIAEHWKIETADSFVFDTTLVGSLLDENRSNSLTTHAKIYTPMGGYDDEFNSKYDKGRMDLVLTASPEDFLTYAGGDTDACYQSALRMREELLKDEALAKFYIEILHPAARAYEHVERVGWCIDVPYYQHLHDELEWDIHSLTQRAVEILGGRLVAKHWDKKKERLNITKASLLIDYFFTPTGLNLKPLMMTAGGPTGEGPKKPSTAMDHLRMFASHPDAKALVEVLEEYGSATKTRDTYIVGFLKHLRRDNRFHPSYFLYSGANDWGDDEGGTVTGRLSVKDPAVQTIPKHTAWAKRLRRAFHAPPGFLVVGHDYSQGELKITACLANEPTMLKAYRDGVDLHAVTASRLAGYTWEQFLALQKTDPEKYDAIRQLGKAGNFGLIYGMKEEGFMSYAYFNYGVKMEYEEAQKNREGFFELYNRLPAWHDEYRNQAKRHGFVRSPLGRVRHLPMIRSFDRQVASKAGRQAINSPVQSTLSDMSLWAAALMWKAGLFKTAPLFGMVHDQNLRFVPEDDYERHVIQGRDIMQNLPFHKLGWQPQLEFTVDSEVGRTLGDLKTLKNLPAMLKAA